MTTGFHVGVWQAAQGMLQSDLVFYVDGVRQTLTQNNPNNTVTFTKTGNVVAVGNGHNPGGGFYPNDFVTADLAVFIIYNRVLSAAEVATLTEYLHDEYLLNRQATNPAPASGSMVDNTLITLNWEPGDEAVTHKVYFSTNEADVVNAADSVLIATTNQSSLLIGLPGQPVPEGLVPGSTYYWRVDEFTTGGTIKGPVWSFTTVGEIPIEDDFLLGWWTMDQVDSTSILDMSGHDNHGTIQGELEWVDGVAGTALIMTEDDLITIPPLNVTIESLTMTAWIKPAHVHGRTGIIFMRNGTLTTGINLMPDNQLGYHWLDGGQALPLAYDNTGSFVDLNGNPASVLLSEISRSFTPPQDLQRQGATALTIWVQGNQANTVESTDSLHLVVRDTAGREAMAFMAPADDLLKFYWQKKTVDLSTLTDADLTQISEIVIGIGQRATPQTGGKGTLLIDNILLSIEEN